MKHAVLASAALFAAACASQQDAAPIAPPALKAVASAPAAAAPAPPAPTPQATSTRTDYAKGETWLCRPGIPNNACDVNLDATIVQADGSTQVEKFSADPNAPIDCFYIYPTVSLDPMTYSDLKAGPEELSVVKTQLARLGSKCRLFAPMYRQFSLGALRARMSGGAAVPVNGAPADPNNDVNDAWNWYLANENKGRGVVILGHSQGSGQITRLIAMQIDGKPVQDQLVSAVIMGSSVQAPTGKDVGGSFKSIPACRAADQHGCVISFSSFRDTLPPSATALFGRGGDGTEAICTNPAALGGGKATAPKVYFSTGEREWAKGKKIDTPFVMTPGLVTTECVRKAGHSYLEVHFNANPSDLRIDDPGTDITGANGKPDAGWGLHLIDANLAMGDLVDVIARQGAAWKKRIPEAGHSQSIR
ncbi:MAG: DUF3089 domain-containing protein [Alphaproteobacteria bacterium]|nr:DUF3089 domain-containing protein [Alphaproteobacteria bacterium]